MTKIDEPVVLRDSRSRWACTASCKRIVLVDLDLDPTAADMVEQLTGQGGFFRRIGDVIRQRRAGHVQRAFHRQQLPG